MIAHDELDRLAIAHIDCDAFYASVEKRDDPTLAHKPVIVGGGRRGVVAAACYIARIRGVSSAMPMYRALKACPDALVIRPDMAKYARVGAEIRALMESVTPLVEPLSVDEAFLDLSGTEALLGASPAGTLIRLIRRMEEEIGITASVGLSYNKFLAKTASDLDKPRGFAVIGRAEALDFLSPRPVGSIWGVGKALERRLTRDGLKTIGQLRAQEPAQLTARYGAIGARLASISRGEDGRAVTPRAKAKSMSAETTFESDIADERSLSRRLWPLSEKVAKRLKNNGISASGVTLKLKTADFRLLTRSRRISPPTRLAGTLFAAGRELLAPLADGRRYRLIGIGATHLTDSGQADTPDLLDANAGHAARLEDAMDAVRAKFGDPAIQKGRALLD